MIKFKHINILLLFLSITIISCENENNQNPIINQEIQGNTFSTKIEGLWRYTEKQDKAVKTVDYYFESNNICKTFKSTSGKEIESNFCTYQVFINNDITTVLIIDKQKRETVLRINRLNDSKMLVVFDLIDNIKQKDDSEVELIKYNPLKN
jgi:hypothetical protein